MNDPGQYEAALETPASWTLRPVKLEIRDVSVSFPGPLGRGPRKVLGGLNLDVCEGEFVCIVGASGSGKSTILRILAGLLAADSGGVRLDGKPVTGPSADSGFVFQSDCLIPWRTVAANVAIALEVRGVAREERVSRVTHALEQVGLADWRAHFPSELSGGMRQRVNIARALAIDPSVILMDEPFAALDAQTREMMQGELLDLRDRISPTVVMVTHQIEEAVFLGDRVVVLAGSPAHVREVVVPDLPRPHDAAVKRTQAFAHHVECIWRLIADDVRASLRRELTVDPHQHG